MKTFRHLMRISKQALRMAATLLLAVALLSVPVNADSSDPADDVVPYENDVFVIVGSTLRNPDSTTEDTAPLFNVAGVGLGLTWGQWRAATATAEAKVSGGSTDIRIKVAGLVPGGVYSVFYGTLNPDSEHPLCPGVERTLPLTVKKATPVGPDDSSFVADASGTAQYRGLVSGDLLGTPFQQVFYFIIYHSDGQTYHPFPNRGEYLTQGETCRSSFGEDAMRQLFIAQK